MNKQIVVTNHDGEWIFNIALFWTVQGREEDHPVMTLEIQMKQRPEHLISTTLSMECKNKGHLIKILAMFNYPYEESALRYLTEITIKEGVLWYVLIPGKHILSGEGLQKGIVEDVVWSDIIKFLKKINDIPIAEAILALKYHELLPEK
jgi:hypothetical protein